MAINNIGSPLAQLAQLRGNNQGDRAQNAANRAGSLDRTGNSAIALGISSELRAAQAGGSGISAQVAELVDGDLDGDGARSLASSTGQALAEQNNGIAERAAGRLQGLLRG